MGLFPIFMNVVQFWLIDSIVKASGTTGIVLSSNQSEPSDYEPLFRSSVDSDDDGGDDDDDDTRGGSDAISTPAKRDIEAQVQGQVQLLRRSTDSSHTYPPRHDDSPTLTLTTTTPAPAIHRASISPPPSLRSVLSVRRHRPPPPPLLPGSPKVPAVNSPDPSSETSPAGVDADPRSKEDWQSWDGEEDWAERVGEEEWTGRRAEARKGEVERIWRGEAS
jgi:hypothetical protein